MLFMPLQNNITVLTLFFSGGHNKTHKQSKLEAAAGYISPTTHLRRCNLQY